MSDDHQTEAEALYDQHIGDMAAEACELSGPTWVTGDGTVMLVSEMSDSHLGNAIAFMKRNHREEEDAFEDLIGEQWKREQA